MACIASGGGKKSTRMVIVLLPGVKFKGRRLSQGGLGIINLEAQNKALLLKHLHKFFNKAKAPWVELT
jgi:hypothetical protein